MLVKLETKDGGLDMEQAEVVPFASVPVRGSSGAHETDLEHLIAENIGLLESETGDEESLLVIARQAVTSTRRRLDLVAIDNTGAIILIEVKRDAIDVQNRADHAEIQAIRYAASLAKLRTVDQLVRVLYEPYVSRYCKDELKDEGGDRTAAEWARKKLQDFIRDNEIDAKQLNHTQKIVLVGASFDDDTKSAAAWMAANGLPIRLIELETLNVGNDYFINVRQLVPVQVYEDLYVDLKNSGSRSAVQGSVSSVTRQYRPRLQALIDAGRVAVGDEIWVEGHADEKATLVNGRECLVDGQRHRLNDWACSITGWSSINIYEWVRHGPSGKYIEDTRNEFEAHQEQGGTEGTSETADSVTTPNGNTTRTSETPDP